MTDILDFRIYSRYDVLYSKMFANIPSINDSGVKINGAKKKKLPDNTQIKTCRMHVSVSGI